tara:strand:- start:18313 stop:19461 length:1149 start_codon:yes stop_codon:yes gene_type:complete
MEGIGLLGLANTLGVVCLLVMEYGFSLSATREIASNNDNKNISLLVSRVLITKLILIIPCFIISICSFLIVPIFDKYQLLIMLTLIISILNGLTPVWYFQGIQKIYPFALLKISIRIISIIPIFFMVRSVNDIWIVLFFQCISSLLICLISLSWLLKKVKFVSVGFKDITNSLINGWHTFSLTIIPPLFTMFAFFWLSSKLSIESIGLLNSAERIFKAIISIFGPIGQAIYPFLISQLSKDKMRAIIQTRQVFWLYLFISISTSSIIIIVANPFIKWYLGQAFLESAKILQVFALSIPIIKISHILGRQWMLSIKLDKIVNIAIILSNLVLFIILTSFHSYYKVFSFPLSLLIAESLLLLFYIIYLQYYKLGFWNSQIEKSL